VTPVAEQQRLHDSPPLNVGRISPLGKPFGRCSRALVNARYDNYRLERVLGMPFLVTPSVFNPKRLRTGQLIASHSNCALIDRDWDSNHFLQQFQQRHYRISVSARRHFLNERVALFKLQAPACPP
jgi:hypothetical protein